MSGVTCEPGDNLASSAAPQVSSDQLRRRLVGWLRIHSFNGGACLGTSKSRPGPRMTQWPHGKHKQTSREGPQQGDVQACTRTGLRPPPPFPRTTVQLATALPAGWAARPHTEGPVLLQGHLRVCKEHQARLREDTGVQPPFPVCERGAWIKCSPGRPPCTSCSHSAPGGQGPEWTA